MRGLNKREMGRMEQNVKNIASHINFIPVMS